MMDDKPEYKKFKLPFLDRFIVSGAQLRAVAAELARLEEQKTITNKIIAGQLHKITTLAGKLLVARGHKQKRPPKKKE